MTREAENKVVITDPGLDDLGAIMRLAKLPSDQLVLVSTFGNIPEGLSWKNLTKIAQVLRLNTERTQVVRGPNRPLDSRHAQFGNKAVYKGNGPDGLWNSSVPEELSEHSVNSAGSLKHANIPKPYELFSLGPLTGVVSLFRGGHRPERTLVMGGAFGEGNVRPINKDGSYVEGGERKAEWNIFKDPRAAKIFFEQLAAGKDVYLVTKDACMGALITAENILNGSYKQTPDIQFLKQVLQGWAIKYGEINPSVVARGLMLADLIAVIGFYNPDFFVWEEAGIEVATDIGPELGVTVRSTSNPKCKVAVAVEDTQISTLMEAINSTVFG